MDKEDVVHIYNGCHSATGKNETVASAAALGQSSSSPKAPETSLPERGQEC